MQKLADLGARLAMTEYRKRECRLGDEKVTAYELERRASWINGWFGGRFGGIFIVAGGDHAQPINFDRNLRRTEDMPAGVQRNLRAGKVDAFAVSQGLHRAGEILAITQPHQVERLLRCQHRAVAGAGVVGMGMGDDGALDRAGRIDMESAAFAANAGRGGDENVFRSDHES